MVPEIPVEWASETVESLMAAIIDYRGKTPAKTTSGVPLVTAKIIKNGRIKKPTEFIARADYDVWMRRGLPRVGDVLITTEAPLGEVAQLHSSDVALAQRVILLRGRADTFDNTFLKFVLQSHPVQVQLRARSSGTTVTGIKQRELRKVTLPVPPLPEQRRIAAILGALDDKIELNRKMNRTLEEMAQAIFKSWFIDFDGVADSELVDSELGLIPRGWEVRPFDDMVEFVTERVKATKNKDSERYVALEDMLSRSIDLSVFRWGSEVNSSIIRFHKGDILFGSMRPYFHKVGLAQFDGITRTTTFVLRPIEAAYRHFLLMHFASDAVVEFSTAASVGSTIPYIKRDVLGCYQIAVPPSSLAKQFDDLLRPVTTRLKANGQESRTLTDLRDTLLPKLISGEIRVPEAEVEVEAAV